jgi:hypothetical protein
VGAAGLGAGREGRGRGGAGRGGAGARRQEPMERGGRRREKARQGRCSDQRLGRAGCHQSLRPTARVSLAGCLSLPFTGCYPMPDFAAMRLRGSGDALLILFAYLETVALYNSRFPVPLPDTLPLLPCGAGGFAWASSRRKAGYRCTGHLPARAQRGCGEGF